MKENEFKKDSIPHQANDQNLHHHHSHSGRSSRSFFDAGIILEKLGNLKAKVVLDVGCGDGHFTIAAARVVGGSGKVIGIDIDKTSIEILENEIKEQGIKNIQPILQDFSKGTSLPGKSIDLCLIVNVLHGFVLNHELEEVMGEIERLMKDNGELFILEFKKVEGTPGPDISERLDPIDVELLVKPFSFKMDNIFDIGLIHYGIIFKR
jgi:ubiquinone/menaquinone biosynthesis C-methylase UbiE